MSSFENTNTNKNQQENLESSPEDIARSQWQSNARLEAMETILGYRVDARDLHDSQDLTTIFTIDNPDDAIAGLLLIKPVETQTLGVVEGSGLAYADDAYETKPPEVTEDSRYVEVYAHGVYEVYDKHTGELVDISVPEE